MSSGRKRTRYLWSTSLIVTVAACTSLLYIYLANKGKIQAENPGYPTGNSVQEKLTEDECIPVCDTTDCVRYAKFMLSNMKPTADPCENLHTFACGAYEERFGQDERGGVHFDTETNALKLLDGILRNIQAEPNTASGKLKAVYDSCMNYASSEKHAPTTAQKFLEKIGIPDWPHLASDFKFVDNDLSIILGNMKAEGELGFLLFMVPTRGPPFNNIPTERINMSVRLDTRFFNKFLRSPPKDSAVRILNYFNLDSEAIEGIWEDYTKVRDAILKLEDENCRDLELECPTAFGNQPMGNCRRVSHLCPHPYDEESWYRRVPESCSGFSVKCSEHEGNWTHICKIVEVYLNASGLHDQINKDYIEIENGDDHFVKRIVPVLNSFPERTVANFFGLNFYLSHLEELNFYFQLTKKTYFAPDRCVPLKEPFVLDRWHFCIQWLIKNMILALQYEFQKEYLTLQEIQKVIDMFQEYASDTVEMVKHQEWIKDNERKFLMSNLGNVTFSLNLLKEYQSNLEKYELTINEYYKSFQPTGENFFHNAIEIRRTISDIHRLLFPISAFLFSMNFDYQAVYSCEYIDADFGIFAPPVYMPGLPRLGNLIILSQILGHEFGHGVDLTIQYMIGGVTEKKRRERERCLENQYSQFKYEFLNENLNGKQYIMENIADNIHALMLDRLIERYDSAGERFLLPGLNYSSKQLLYMAVNEKWCSKTKEREEQLYKAYEGHAPLKIRGIGSMQNSRGYSEAFNCPNGSFMNPTTKCSLLDYF